MPSCTQKPRSSDHRPLLAAFLLTAGYLLVEVVGGILSGSLALLSDAGHMFADAGALALSLTALWLARRPADPLRTYGYARVEILAALVNGVFLWGMVLLIFREAWERFWDPTPVKVPGMMGVALLGLAVNAASLVLLHRGHRESLNVRAAFLHVLGDTLGSVGVVAAGGVILLTGWTRADSLAGALIGVLILISSWGLLKEAVHVLLEGTPAHVDLGRIKEEIGGLPGVEGLHDVHVWTLTPGTPLFSAHLEAAAGLEDPDRLRREVESLLEERYGIGHVTIQIEGKGMGCRGCAG